MPKWLQAVIFFLTGKTKDGLDKEFAKQVEEFKAKYPERIAEWERQHPGEPLPIQIDPNTADLVWAAREVRKQYKNRQKGRQ